MVLGVLTVLVVLASGEPDGAAPAMEQALRAALPEGARVLVRQRGDGSDGTWLARGKDEQAALVGVVTWSEKQRSVVVHFVRPDEGRWSDREIRFDATDATQERGRTVGFALASMVPEDVLAKATAEAASTPAAQPASTAQPAPGVAPTSTPASTVEAAAGARPTSPREEAPPPAPLGARARPSIEAAGIAAVALGGYGGGLGATVALRIPISSTFRVRVGASARASDVGPAQASSRVLGGAVGLAWQTWVDGQRRWAAGARLDAIVQHHELVHFSSDDPEPASQVRWMPAVAGALEVGWRFTEQAAVVGAMGLEGAFGTSTVLVAGQEVATIPPVRALGEAGLRVSF